MRTFVYLPGFLVVFLFACSSSPRVLSPEVRAGENKRIKQEDAQLLAEVRELEAAARSESFKEAIAVQPVGVDAEPKRHEEIVPPKDRAIGVQPVSPTTEPRKFETSTEFLSELIRGNERFIQDKLQNFNARDFRSRALASQTDGKPQVAVLLPSHAQMNPELIFDQSLGSFYSIRAISNVLGAAQVASIEYAVKHMDARLVVILDQEPKLLQAHAKGESLDLDWVWEENKNENRYPASESKAHDPLITQLLQRSKIVREAHEKGSLKVIRAVYHTGSGRVDFK